VLVGVFHHISSDGWSDSILVREFVELYNASQQNRVSNLSPLPLQYADYAIWQRSYLDGEIIDLQLSYWEEQLQGVSPLELPTDHPRPSVQSNAGASLNVTIDKPLSDALRAFSLQKDVTLFMTLLATFKVLLSKYSGQTDICVGTPIANRTQEDLERMMGFFVNTLALRSEVVADQSFIEFLQKVKETLLAAYEYQNVPFEKVVDRVVKVRDLSRNPLFQVLFSLQNIPTDQDIELGNLSITPYEDVNITATSKFELNFTLKESPKGIQLMINYCTSLFKEATIERMVVHYKKLLNSIVSSSNIKLSELSMLTKKEEAQLLIDFNATDVDYPKDKTIVDLFEEQVAKTPDNVAVVYEGHELSYRELDAKSNQLARYLHKKGVKPDTLVGICIDSRLEMIVGILSVLKSGGAYVPIDPEYPVGRINYILKDAGIEILLSTEEVMPVLEEREGLDIIFFDRDWSLVVKESESELERFISLENLAYVIYTSGSTGRPKGVMIDHKNLSDYSSGLVTSLDIQISYQYGLLSTLSADLGNTSLFSSIITGGTLHLFSKSNLMNALFLNSYFNNHRIDFIKIVPKHWLSLEYNDEMLIPKEGIIFGGDVFLPSILEKIKNTAVSDIRIVNHYGPTETTIGKLFYEVDLSIHYENIPLGKPFSDTQIYILDAQENLKPIGVVGELCIGGAGLSRGYLNNKILTQDKFVSNPFKEGERIYKTGDLARWLPDGNIEFVGRNDEQLKIRGYRIELGEIDSIVLQQEGVKSCCVVAKTSPDNSKYLVGYVVAEGVLDKEVLQTELKRQLPGYMVPQLWVELEELPLTSNGKIDRKSLPDPELSDRFTQEYVAPRNKTEELLAEIWQELLVVERIGVHDNFFDLGGHSLLAIRLVSRIQEKMSKQISMAQIFECNTLEQLSEVLISGVDTNFKIIGFNKDGYKAPIFFAPPVAGIALAYTELAALLGKDQPVFGFQCPGINRDMDILESVRELAEEFIKEMQKISPNGPYRLGGYSFGGKVALEMAFQLERDGFEVVELISIDGIPNTLGYDISNVGPEEILLWITEGISKITDNPINLTRADLAKKTEKEQLDLVNKFAILSGNQFTENQIKGLYDVFAKNATMSYDPKSFQKINASIILFKSNNVKNKTLDEKIKIHDYGWSNYTEKEVVVFDINATHSDLIKRPFIDEIAKHVKSFNSLLNIESKV